MKSAERFTEARECVIVLLTQPLNSCDYACGPRLRDAQLYLSCIETHALRMNLAIRPADLERDRKAMLALLVEHFADWAEWKDERKFDWLYVENPMGTPRTWLLECGDEIVGLSSAFRRRLRVEGRTSEAWVLGDFCVAKEHRSLGPAMALQRATCERVDRGDVDLWYDFPSRTMTAIYGRMGVNPGGEMVRLVYPLRVDRMLEKQMPNGFVATGLREVGNKVLASRDAVRRRDASIEVSLRDRDFEADVESGIEAKGGISLERSAAYLNWRYRTDPRGPASILAARRGGREEGVLVFRYGERDVHIWDAFAIADTAVFRELVLEVIEIARSRDAVSVTAVLSDRHAWMGPLEKLGFHRRDSAPFFVYAGRGVLKPNTSWILMSGDRD